MLDRFRRSFAAKILAALAGTVAVLMAVTLAVVRSETGRQVEAATERAVEGAARQLRDLQEIQRQQVARVARPLTEGRRTLAALDEAIEAGDQELLAGLASYEMDLAELTDVLVAFTDARGRTVLTLHNDMAMEEGDPVGVEPLAEELFRGGAPEVEAYRVADGTLFSLRTRLIQLAGRPIGTLSLGLPLTHEDVGRIGDLAGAEVCFVVDGACVAGSEGARGPLAPVLVAAAAGEGGREGGDGASTRVSAAGTVWSVRAQPLVAEDPSRGWRVTAVPLDPILAPYRRIEQALLLGGGGALALALLVGGILSRGLTRPVRALAAATERVARGDLEAEVEVESRDEVGRLAGAFNRMTRDLRVKEQYRSVLDKVVSPEVAKQLMEGGVELGGENRRVTVLFADVRGFTALTDGMEPQSVIGLLNECMQRLSEAVEAEGGVVDKYVGDEVMAVFGAPVDQPDDALRAVRAAVRMQRSVDELNAGRRLRGEPPIHLGVGLNTGEVVAGNMGSPNRLNYTVLGSTVNLASRLCGAAEGGEILLTRQVVAEAGPGVEVEDRGEQVLKGVAGPVRVYAVKAAPTVPGEAPGPSSASLAPVVALLLGASLAFAPLEAAGQWGDGAWPTLSDAGLGGWISPSGTWQVDLSGRLDVELYAHSASDPRPRERTALVVGRDVWAAPRLRLLADLFAGDHVYGLLELRADRGHGPERGEEEARVEQAFLRVATSSGSLALQAGRFATPFGQYAGRHFTEVDPFVRPPLPYDYRTMICPGILPPDPAAFISWRFRPDEFRDVGAPPIWGVPYQWGAMASGVAGPLSWRLAAMNSAPSSPPGAWGWDGERMEHPSWVAGLTARLDASLTVGASWNRGPYLEPIQQGSFPEDGSGRFDYVQEIVSVEATWARGPLLVRGEAFHDRWEVPNLPEDPVELGYTLELQADVSPGLFLAGRVGVLDFRPLADGRGSASPYPGGEADWDDDVARWEVGVGYRWARNAGVLASGSLTRQTGDFDADDDLLALRLWWAF